MKTLVLANQKGGVGKSAVATLLVHYFAQHGQRVLAIKVADLTITQFLSKLITLFYGPSIGPFSDTFRHPSRFLQAKYEMPSRAKAGQEQACGAQGQAAAMPAVVAWRDGQYHVVLRSDI